MSDFTMVKGAEFMSLEVLALLSGVSYDDAQAEFARQQQETPGRFLIPNSWTRGCKELQAKHGTRDYDELIARIRADRSAS
jgi:hypothetical protein